MWIACLFTCAGDLMGPSIKGLDNLLQMPCGCGEQNMLHFAPDVYIVKYLSIADQLTVDLKRKALGFMNAGQYNTWFLLPLIKFPYIINDICWWFLLIDWLIDWLILGRLVALLTYWLIVFKGYQRELTYQRSDGSFSAFGNSDQSGSVW